MSVFPHCDGGWTGCRHSVDECGHPDRHYNLASASTRAEEPEGDALLACHDCRELRAKLAAAERERDDWIAALKALLKADE